MILCSKNYFSTIEILVFTVALVFWVRWVEILTILDLLLELTGFSLWNFSDGIDRKLTIFNCEVFLLMELIHTSFLFNFGIAQKHLEYKVSEISLEEQSFDLNKKLCLTEWLYIYIYKYIFCSWKS